MSRLRYDRALATAAGPRCAHTGVELVPVACDCPHGQHDAHWVRFNSPKAKAARKDSKRRVIRRRRDA